MMLPASRRVENAWMTLEQRGAPPVELLSADIYDSWMRCISFGLDTLRPPSPEFVSPAILRQEQQRVPSGRRVFAVLTASARRRISNARLSCMGAIISFPATTISPVSQRLSSRPTAN